MIDPQIINQAKQLHAAGYSISKISKELGISRAAIRDNVVLNKIKPRLTVDPANKIFNNHEKKCYSYLLGLYYGDGCISKYARTYKLRIFLGRHETDVSQMAKQSINCLFPTNKINDYPLIHSKCNEISVYSSKLLAYFPDHGEGKKHSRQIALVDWQKNIVEEYPEFFVTGLYDADGCGYYDNGYLKYNFVNTSKDIFDMFTKYTGLEYGIFCRPRPNGWKDMNIARLQSKDNTLAFQTLINRVYSYFNVTIDTREYKI